jgi:hypothetical protein|tara:strand:- start:90 stop:1355 length:1266 start_codon:yes stop_codon:yes gene_type:complete
MECGEGKYYCNTDQKCKPIPKGYKVMHTGELVKEGSLHKWFSKSKSKDGKKGWVNVVTGGTCASDKPGEGTPKCVSSAKRASMTKAERLSAQRRKKKADPNQQSKSGAAKPTYVRTDKPKKKMKEATIWWSQKALDQLDALKMDEAKVDQGKDDAAKKNERNQRTFGNRRGSKGSMATHDDTEARRYNTAKGRGVKMKGKKDKTPVNYHKKDSQKRVDALLKSMKEGVKRDEYGDIVGGPKISKKQKAKNLSKNEPDNKIVRSESAAWTRKAGKNKEGGLNEKGRKSYERENPGSDLKAPSKKVGNPRRKSFCARMKGMKKKLTSAKTARDPDSRINKSLRAWNCSYEWPKDKEMIETTSLKNEIIAKAQEKHKEAKQKKYKQIMDAGKAAKKRVGKDPRGVRALSKGKWGYVKNNQFTPD